MFFKWLQNMFILLRVSEVQSSCVSDVNYLEAMAISIKENTNWQQ